MLGLSTFLVQQLGQPGPRLVGDLQPPFLLGLDQLLLGLFLLPDLLLKLVNATC